MEQKIDNYNGEIPLPTEVNHLINDKRQFEIAKLGQMAISITDIDSFMQNVINIIKKSFRIEFVGILELSQDQTKLKLIQGTGWGEELIGNFLVEVNCSTQAGYTLFNNKPIIVENFTEEKRFGAHKLFVDLNIQSGVSIVINGKIRPFGLLGVHSQRPMKFTVDDINFLSSVSNILSFALIQQEYLSKLKEEEEKHQIFMEYASDAMVIFDQKGKILDVNTKACEMTKFTKEELLNKKIGQLFNEYELKKVPIKFQEVERGEHVILERNLQTKIGTTIRIEISSTLLPNGTIQGIYRDITNRKETEEFMRNFQKMEAIERVSASLAHDFTNYLSVINGYTEKILVSLSKRDVDEIFQDVEQIQKIINRSTSLTREVSKFGSKSNDTLEVVNINDLLRELDEPMSILVGSSIILTLDLAPDLQLIEINMNHFHQIMINLIINSRDAITSGGSININTFNYSLSNFYNNYAFNARPGEYIALSISDTGVGMSDGVKAHLFEPFFTTKQDKGTGMGLSSIYGFMKKYDGFISVKSVLGKGTSITIFFPQVFKF